MGNKYTISAYEHDNQLIKGVQNLHLNPDIQQLLLSASGEVDPTFIGVSQLQPEIIFDATAIRTALHNIGGITGKRLDNDNFYFQKMVADGTRTDAGNKKVTANQGIIIPTCINAAALLAESTISYRVVPISEDGFESPLAITYGWSLNYGQDQISEVFVLGPVSVNGDALDGVERWVLDFNIELEIIFRSGGIYPTFVGIKRRMPTITICTSDVDAFESWDIEGVVQGGSDSKVKLLDQVMGGGRGSSPITLTVDAGIINFRSIGGRHGQLVNGPAAITPVWDGTHDIVALSGVY